MSLRLLVLCLASLLLAACGSQDVAPLPTQLDLNAVATENAATAAALASPTRERLPPTWTPSPQPTQPPTEVVQAPTASPTGFSRAGTLYYIYNGDAIVRLVGDGSFEELLPIPHISLGISDLAISPDGAFLAYAGPGSGSAREIYITDRMGNNTRQVSQLGYSVIRNLVWRPDSGALAFIAAQSPEFPSEIYVVGSDGSGQRSLVQRSSRELRDLVWNETGSRLFFSDDSVFAVDVVSGTLTPPLSAYTGFGPDFGLAHSPSVAQLYYLKPLRNLDTGVTGYILTRLDTGVLDPAPKELSGARLDANRLRFSQDGSYLLISNDSSVWVQSQAFNTSVQIVHDAATAPMPTLSPDNEKVAFINLDESGVQQIYTVSRQGGAASQLTFHQEGSISDLVWVEG